MNNSLERGPLGVSLEGSAFPKPFDPPSGAEKRRSCVYVINSDNNSFIWEETAGGDVIELL
jgi:hypothetical protein